MRRPFLKAEWRKLAIANYAVDSSILRKFLPARMELDHWKETCYISLVGFMFLNTRIKGIPIPFHINFEEVNLRFYVRYNVEDGVKRGVVFIKEIVSKPAVTVIANVVYKENYETMPMKYAWKTTDASVEIMYGWKKNDWNSFTVRADNHLTGILAGSEEEFITEHFWGYTKINEKHTFEYEVDHPRWKVYPVKEYSVRVDFATVYGPEFEFLNRQKPSSVFLVEGSEIVVRGGSRV